MAGYCIEADVIGITGLTFGAATQPTTTQVATFIDNRSGQIYGWLSTSMGVYTPGPSGYDVTIDATTDAGKALGELTERANATAAAADAIEAAIFSDTPQRSERVKELLDDFEEMKDDLMELGKLYMDTVAGVDASDNHIAEGRVTVDTWVSKTQQGFAVDTDTEF